MCIFHVRINKNYTLKSRFIYFLLLFSELLEPPNVSNLDSSSVVSADSSRTAENDPNTDILSDTTHDETEIVSETLSSPDISDHELPTEETSHDDSAEHIVVRDRERRDSGVGSSLTRTNRYC